MEEEEGETEENNKEEESTHKHSAEARFDGNPHPTLVHTTWSLGIHKHMLQPSSKLSPGL